MDSANNQAVKQKNEDKLGVNTLLTYFVVMIAFVAVRICSHFGLFSFLGDYGSYFLSLFTQVGLILLIPIVMFKLLNKMKLKDCLSFLGFKKISFLSVLMCIVLGVVVFLLNIYVSNFFNSIIQFFGYKPSSAGSTMPAEWWVLVLNLLCTAVLPAICEEVLHRGMLLRGLSEQGMKKAILISGLLFGLLHLNIEQFFYATIIGFFLGYLAYGTNSIYPCMIVHFMNNALSVFLAFARQKKWAIGNIISTFVEYIFRNQILGIVIMILILCLLLVLAFELTKQVFLDSFSQEFKRSQKEFATMAMRQSYFQQIENIKDGIEERPIFTTKEDAVFIDSKEFLAFVKENIQSVINKAGEMNKKPKLPAKGVILLWGLIALGVIITIMTFIWGLL